MKKTFQKLVLWCLVVVMTALSTAAFSTSAKTESQLRNEIAKLERESSNIDKQIGELKSTKAEKQKIVDAYQVKINNMRQQITLCNNEVNKIRAKVSANQAEIDRKNTEIAENMLTFKKRLRVSYMNGTYNSSLVVLGSSEFSNYLGLEELTTSVASHDRQLIEKIVAEIKVLERIKAENEKLLKDQVAIQNELVAKQQELKSAQNEVQKIINSAVVEMNDLSDEQADIQAKIKKDRKELEEKIRTAQPIINREMNASGFIWPVPGYYTVTQHFGNNGHTGMDIAQ
ncbi:MAG: hypothetical protein MJ132_03260, partial [Clostridia bacterium]|nr:hypothetical protein [Clostridia bacterium]